MDDRADAALVEETLAGGRDAFAALVHRYQNHAYGLAVGRVCDLDLARDVAEETFLCAHRDLATLQKPSRFGGWLRGIVRNLSLRTFREVQRIRALAEALDLDEDLISRCRPSDPPDAEAWVRTAVRQALEGLNDRNREVVGLHYMSDLSPRQIGGFIGTSETSVRKRLERVREDLAGGLRVIEVTFEASGLPDDFAEEVARLAAPQEQSADETVELPSGALGEALGDPQELVRRVSGDTGALRPLLRLLHAPDAARARDRQVDMALAVPGVREALLDTLGRGRKVDRIYAMAALRRLRDDAEVHARVARLFREPQGNGRVARMALFVLCDLRPDEAPELVAEGLRSPSGQVRAGAAWEAVSRGLQPSVEECMHCFESGMPWQGLRHAGRLVLGHGEAGRSALQALMESGSPSQRLSAAVVLAEAGSDAAFDVLKRGLLGGKNERSWRRAIARAAGGEYPESLTSWVEEDSGAMADLAAVAWTLARGGAAKPTPVLEALAAHAEPAARAAALRMLAAHEGTQAIPLLRDCLRAGRPRKVAQEAFRQMLQIGDDAAPVAREMLGSEHWTERKAAVGLLRRWGMLTEGELAAAQEDEHVAVRHAAGLRPPLHGV